MMLLSHRSVQSAKHLLITHLCLTLHLILKLIKKKKTNGFPGDSDGKESAWNARDPSLISGLGRTPVGRNGNPLKYSCLGNLKDRGAWWAIVHGVAKSWTGPKWLTLTYPCSRSYGTCWGNILSILLSWFFQYAIKLYWPVHLCSL